VYSSPEADRWVWCRKCQRAWPRGVLSPVLTTAGWEPFCPDWECGGRGWDVDLKPYSTARRQHVDWPVQPALGLRLVAPLEIEAQSLRP